MAPFFRHDGDGLTHRTGTVVRHGILSGGYSIGILMANNENYGTLAQASAKGTVKWFNVSKGYGFITLENGGDAFCHASALAALGTTNLPQGASIVCDVQESPRGLQVVAVHKIDASSAAPSSYGASGYGASGYGASAPRRPRRDYGEGERSSAPSGATVEGKVKFFNDQKGFGFVVPDDGSGDIYLHANALRRSGIVSLEPEQRIRFSTRQGVKGVEVDRIETI